MEQVSKKMLIYVPWFRKKLRHRGELLNFDPSENLENSTCTGEKTESCSSCSSIYRSLPLGVGSHIYLQV